MVDGVEEPGEAEGQTEQDTNVIAGSENQQEEQQGQASPGHPTQASPEHSTEASPEDNRDTQDLNSAVTEEETDAGEAEAEADVGEVAIEGEEAAFEGQEETALEGEEAAFEGQEETAFEGQEETAFEGQEETAFERLEETAFEGQEETSFEGQEETALKAEEAAFEGQEDTAFEGQEETTFEGQEETAFEGQEETAFEGVEEAFEGQEEAVAADTDFDVNEAGDTELDSGELEPEVFEEGLQPEDPVVAEVEEGQEEGEVEGGQEEGDIHSPPGEGEHTATTNEQDGDLVEQMVEEEGEDPDDDDSQLVVDEYEHEDEDEQDPDVHQDGVQEPVEEEEEEEIDVGTEQDTLSHVALVQYGGEEGPMAPIDEDPLVPADEGPVAHTDEEGPVAHTDEEGLIAPADEEGDLQGEPGADYHIDDTVAQDEVLAEDVHHDLTEQIDEQAVYPEPEEQPEGVEEDHHAPEDQANEGQEAMDYVDENFEVAQTPGVEEAMEVDETPALAVPEAKDEYDINGIDAEDEDIEDQAMSPQDLFNIAPTDDRLLPQCRLKRNYSCTHCGFTTQNPREHLYHLRDDHGERMKVFECPRCIYASKNQQKLIRHARMVHKLKIKRASDSSSPYKRSSQAKSPRAKVSPTKSARDSMSPGKSSRSSPGKSPRSSEYDWGEGIEDEEEEEEEAAEADEESPPGKGEEKKYFCPQCDYTCKSRKLLNKHETSLHLKRRFFRCQKCNYVTHLKGRYTKHMKYHQLPILKCEYCDFRTPYRWNLDRHMKNHTEECGEFKCHLCNFTAQIKQSLTVHISNHHLTAEQIREKEMRRTIGISDPADCTSDDQENELLRMERDEHPEALMLPGFDSRPQSPADNSSNHHNGNNSFRVSNIDVSHQEDTPMNADDTRDEDGEPRKKKPKIKMTLTKMKLPKTKDTFFQELNERHNFEEDFIHPDDVVHRHGNVYIKTFKCQFCPFKAAFQNEIARHEKKIHSVHTPKLEVTGKAKKTMKALKSFKSLRGSKPGINNDVTGEILQLPRPYNSGQDSEKEEENEVEGPVVDLKVKEEELSNPDSRGENSARTSPEPLEEPSSEHSMDAKDLSPSKDPNKKKGQSFFEKLQEKIPTSNVQNLVCQFCGHESKCLSESVRHQKLHLSAKNIYASASLSTRCQFCRHRCKTTDDLITHLKLCPEARKNQITDSGRRPSGPRMEGTEDSLEPSGDRDEDSRDSSSNREPSEGADDEDKHPMENRVFVWNKWNRFQVQEDSEQNGDGPKLRDGTETIVKDIKKLLPEATSSLDDSLNRSNSEETLDYIESQSPKGNHYYTKRVYRCPQCSFWATTASRFHVHIVGHFNKKPYNCSECGYKSNWRWDITKHIKLKTSRDNSHQGAQVIITDETGEKNYEKYDCYLTIIQLDEPNAHRTEGGIPTRKGRPKRTPEKEEDRELATPEPSPKRSKPPMVTIPAMPRFPGLPRLTRAPGTGSKRPGPMPFGPMMRGAQMMVQIAGSAAAQAKPTQSRPPPPLSLRGTSKPSPPTGKSTSKETTETTTAGAQYQIITPQGAVNTSLETLQLLASGSTNLTRLKKQHQKGDSEATEEKDRQAAVSHQVSVSSTGEDGREVSKMVLDHEGNPEWKCHSCDFRDSERETVNQHVRLAHGRGGPVSLLHAVHRCDVCGYAAGTKRAVQMHIDSSHGGQGGITSRSEGQTPEPKDSSGDSEVMEYNESLRRFQCRQCPYSCKKRSDMRTHQAYHAPRPDCIFKCMFCPYYVPTKGELFEHLNVHGMEVPGLSMGDAANKAANSPANSLLSPTNQEEGGSRNLVCDHCPFESRSRAKLMHHRQFHKPKGLPYRCPHCSYNVTRRHLLSQHIRVHGVDQPLDDNADANDTSHPDERSNSPSPSLTITPVNSVAANTDAGGDKGVTDSSLLPKLTDQSTMVLSDIPLVWVSRDNRFFKMFKCRHCPHVNLRKTNIQEHEKMHKTDAARESGGLHCPYCTYVSINAGVMSAHMKVHAGSMGQCHAVVDPMLSDEDQLRRLTTKASTSRPATPQAQETSSSMPPPAAKVDEKLIYYCQQCPARFFFEKEIQIHTRFHTTILPYKCEHCDYGARQQPHLLAHMKVHTPEYQERTRTMMAQHRTAASYPSVPGLTIPQKTEGEAQEGQRPASAANNTVPATASPPPTNNVPPQPAPTSKYKCDQCPASFSKLLTLQYHQSLHGGNNANQCHRCSYTSKTAENLHQHMLLHSQDDERVQAESYPTKDIKKEKITEQLATEAKPVEAKKAEGSKSEAKGNTGGGEGDPPYHPPIKLKLIGLRPVSTDGSGGRPQFKYYVEEQIPLSGVDLLKRKTQLEKEGHDKSSNVNSSTTSKPSKSKRDADIEDDPKRIGDPNLHYPMHIDKVSGKTREKRYKCSKCPSAFEKTEQYYVHSNLHGSNHKYKCRICDYSVKFYANFMMHINRHKYHERMLHQNSQGSPPDDLDPKYEPVINNSESAAAEKPTKAKPEDSNKENLDDVDMTTSERQHLLLQNKKGVKELASKDDEKEKRVYYCQFCPYANVRRDAVDSHSLRHQANGGCGVYKCTFCDYTASQPNFIREHTKVHFRPFKYVHPEGFMRHDRQEILSTPVPLPGSKVVEGPKTQETTDQDKYLIFAHNAGLYKPPPSTSQNNQDDEVDSQLESGIEVNFHSGDIVDAPSDFVISLRVSKSKNGVGFVEPGDHYAGDLDLHAGPSTEHGNFAYPHTEDGIRYRKGPQPEGVEGRDESMDVDMEEENVNSGINESQKNQLTNGSVQGKAGDAMELDMDGESPKSELKGSISKSFKTKTNVTVSSH